MKTTITFILLFFTYFNVFGQSSSAYNGTNTFPVEGVLISDCTSNTIEYDFYLHTSREIIKQEKIDSVKITFQLYETNDRTIYGIEFDNEYIQVVPNKVIPNQYELFIKNNDALEYDSINNHYYVNPNPGLSPDITPNGQETEESSDTLVLDPPVIEGVTTDMLVMIGGKDPSGLSFTMKLDVIDVEVIYSGSDVSSLFNPLNGELSCNSSSEGARIISNTSDYELSIFPNPVTDILNLSLEPTIEIKNIQLIDASGKMQRNLITLDKKQIMVHDLPKGLYFLSIQTTEQIYTKKFIKY